MGRDRDAGLRSLLQSVVGCFTKARNHRQISTEIFFFDRGYPSQSDLECLGLPASDCPVFIVRHSRLMICKVGEFILKG